MFKIADICAVAVTTQFAISGTVIAKMVVAVLLVVVKMAFPTVTFPLLTFTNVITLLVNNL